MKIKLIKSIIAPSLFCISTTALSQTNTWIEAETGAEYGPIVVKSDPEASQKIYLAPWRWGDYSQRSADNGVISFNVDIPEPGNYTLWGRFKLPWSGISPYDIALGDAPIADDSQWQPWAPASIADAEIDTWLWRSSGLTLNLPSGPQTIKFVQTAGGPSLKFDKLLVTNDLTFTPNGQGGDEILNSEPSLYKANTVSQNGQLQVIGTSLSNENGAPIQLQGISTHGLQWFPLIKQQTIPRTAEFFGSEVIRLAMYIEDYAPSDPSDYWGGYMAEPEDLTNAARSAIDDAIAAGIYVIADWHIHNIPSNFISEAELFFDEISRDYGHYPNVIYEIANEPLPDANWDTEIRPYAIRVIEAIRRNDPDGVIIVGTPSWSQGVDIAANNPLPFDNIMYAFHFYAGTHGIEEMTNKAETAMNRGAAIFVSEWGTSDVGTSTSNFAVARQWMDFMNQHQLSWVNWSLGNKDETSSLLKPTASMSGPWTDSDLTESGLWLKPEFDAPDGGSGNNPPIASSFSVSVQAGQSAEFVLAGSDSDGSVVSYNLVSGPSFGELTLSGNDASYTPFAGFSGEDTFRYSVTDNEGASSAPATVTLNVADSPTPTPTPTTPTPTPSPTPTPPITPSPTITPTPTPGPIDPESGISCSVRVDDWSNGYVAYVTVTNATASAVTSWQVNLNIGANDVITNSWSSQLTRSGSQLSLVNFAYNGSLQPGDSIEIGFQASFDGQFAGVSCAN